MPPSPQLNGTGSATNGPCGAAAVARPMHCRLLGSGGLIRLAAKYSTYVAPTLATVGAHSAPSAAHAGLVGMPSCTIWSHSVECVGLRERVDHVDGQAIRVRVGAVRVVVPAVEEDRRVTDQGPLRCGRALERQRAQRRRRLARGGEQRQRHEQPEPQPAAGVGPTAGSAAGDRSGDRGGLTHAPGISLGSVGTQVPYGADEFSPRSPVPNRQPAPLAVRRVRRVS